MTEASERLHRIKEVILQSRPEEAMRACVAALKAGVSIRGIVASATFTAAKHFEFEEGQWDVRHGLLTLSAATRLESMLQPGDKGLALAQALWHLALEKKRTSGWPSPRRRIEGEETHLALSFRRAVREGNADEADVLFAGLLREGRERRLAGETLFAAAAEDHAMSHHKLIMAVELWRLAGFLGWSGSREILRPAVIFASSTPKDHTQFAGAQRAVTKLRLDLTLARFATKAMTPGDQDVMISALRSGYHEHAGMAVVEALNNGVGPNAIVDILSSELAGSLASAKTFDLEAIGVLELVNSTRFFLTYSRNAEVLLLLIVTSAAVGEVLRRLPADEIDPVGAGGLEGLIARIDSTNGRSASSHVRGYLQSGGNPNKLFPLFATEAVKDNAEETEGHSLRMTSVALEEFAANQHPGRWKLLAAAANQLALAPKSREVYKEFLHLRGPTSSSTLVR